MLVDAVTGASVAGGVVTAVRSQDSQRPRDAFQLTRSLLKQGVGADLGHDAASEQELRRRANEVAILLRGAGVAVEIDDRWAQADADAATVWLSVLLALSFGFVAAVVLGAV
jgi:bifunctional enzyme CysN/CysC